MSAHGKGPVSFLTGPLFGWPLAATAAMVLFHFRLLVLALRAVIRNFLADILAVIHILMVLVLPVFKGLVFLFVTHFQSRPFPFLVCAGNRPLCGEFLLEKEAFYGIAKSV